ncbi:MAG: DUF2306 domain-containing protein [Bacteroidia bacterium]
MKYIKNSIGLALIPGIIAMISISLAYFGFQPETKFLQSKWSVQHLLLWQIGFKIHVWSAIFTLLFGFLQFIDFFRLKFPSIHKISGYFYFLMVILLAGPGGLIMGIYGNGGISAQTSFVISAFLWILTSLLALKSIKNKKVKQHYYWVCMSYGLCLSAITLRIYVLVFPYFFHLPSSQMYALVAWLSWIPNLILAHYYAKNQVVN